MENIYFRREQAAEYLNVSPRTISDWQHKRLIPVIKAGRKCVLFKRDDLDKAMNKLTIQAVG